MSAAAEPLAFTRAFDRGGTLDAHANHPPHLAAVEAITERASEKMVAEHASGLDDFARDDDGLLRPGPGYWRDFARAVDAVMAHDDATIDGTAHTGAQWAELVATPARGGRRQRKLMRIGMKVGAHLPEEMLLAEMLMHNRATCCPPRRASRRSSTRDDYLWQLEVHLLPFFRHHRLSQITVAEVDRYRQAKLAAGKLGPTSINKTITRLAQVLEVAVEYGHLQGNPARGKRRRVKSRKPRHTYLDRAEQIGALLAAAGQLDDEARVTAKLYRRALLATLTFAGLRISELIALDWPDVDLHAKRLTVRESKTDAGIRQVDLLPVLHAELTALKAAQGNPIKGPVFPSAAGTRQDRNRVRTRVLANAVKRADESLAEAGLSALPDGMTLHALRRTFASVLTALGHDGAYVMAQMGHTSPAMTYGRYAQSIRPEDRARLRALVEGADVARSGDDGAVTTDAAPALGAS